MNFSDGGAIAVGFDGASPTQILPNVQSLHYYKLCNGFVPEALVHTYFLSRSGFTGPVSALRTADVFWWAKMHNLHPSCGGDGTSNKHKINELLYTESPRAVGPRRARTHPSQYFLHETVTECTLTCVPRVMLKSENAEYRGTPLCLHCRVVSGRIRI